MSEYAVVVYDGDLDNPETERAAVIELGPVEFTYYKSNHVTGYPRRPHIDRERDVIDWVTNCDVLDSETARSICKRLNHGG